MKDVIGEDSDWILFGQFNGSRNPVEVEKQLQHNANLIGEDGQTAYDRYNPLKDYKGQAFTWAGFQITRPRPVVAFDLTIPDLDKLDELCCEIDLNGWYIGERVDVIHQHTNIVVASTVDAEELEFIDQLCDSWVQVLNLRQRPETLEPLKLSRTYFVTDGLDNTNIKGIVTVLLEIASAIEPVVKGMDQEAEESLWVGLCNENTSGYWEYLYSLKELHGLEGLRSGLTKLLNVS